MRIWFMRIFARPKKTHEPRTRCISFYLTHFRSLGQKSKNNFVRFWVQMRTRKIAFEIFWPLELNRKTKMTCVIEKPFANMHSEIKTHTHRMGKCKSWNWAFNYTLFWKSKISALKSVNSFLKLRINFLFDPNIF